MVKMGESELDQVQDFERFPKLREEMKNKGDSVVVTFVTEEKTVEADVVKAALERKGIDNIKATKSIVIVAEKEDGERREIWHKVTDFTALKQLKVIKDANSGTLKGARVEVTRLAVNSPKEPNWKYETVRE